MSNMSDEATIDLRKDDQEPEFKIRDVSDETSVSNPSETIKVKFGKFVSLVANHDYDEIIEKHRAQDVIIKADLLTELASIPQVKEDRKIPLIFIVGLVLGVIVTWILLKT